MFEMKKILYFYVCVSQLFFSAVSASSAPINCSKNNLADCIKRANQAHEKGNYEEAQKLYQSACHLQDAKSCLAYADFQMDKKICREYLNKACELGNLQACGKLGGTYREEDPRKAVKLIKRACDGLDDPALREAFCSLAQDIEKQSNSGSAVSHLELHKILTIGTKFGQRYRVYSRFGNRGHHLENPAVEADFRTRIKISEDSLDRDQRARLYDLRGRAGCFEGALMDNGLFELSGVNTGQCK